MNPYINKAMSYCWSVVGRALLACWFQLNTKVPSRLVLERSPRSERREYTSGGALGEHGVMSVLEHSHRPACTAVAVACTGLADLDI